MKRKKKPEMQFASFYSKPLKNEIAQGIHMYPQSAVLFFSGPYQSIEGSKNHFKYGFSLKLAKDKQKCFLNNKMIFLDKIIIRTSCQRNRGNLIDYKLPKILSKLRSQLLISTKVMRDYKQSLKSIMFLNYQIKIIFIKIKNRKTHN